MPIPHRDEQQSDDPTEHKTLRKTLTDANGNGIKLRIAAGAEQGPIVAGNTCPKSRANP